MPWPWLNFAATPCAIFVLEEKSLKKKTIRKGTEYLYKENTRYDGNKKVLRSLLREIFMHHKGAMHPINIFDNDNDDEDDACTQIHETQILKEEISIV